MSASKNPFKEIRESRGIKQKFLAEAIDVSPVFMCQFETGAKDMSFRNVRALVRFYKDRKRPLTSQERKSVASFLLDGDG